MTSLAIYFEKVFGFKMLFIQYIVTVLLIPLQIDVIICDYVYNYEVAYLDDFFVSLNFF